MENRFFKAGKWKMPVFKAGKWKQYPLLSPLFTKSLINTTMGIPLTLRARSQVTIQPVSDILIYMD